MTASRSSLNLPESVVMRWALKAFLVGLFLGAIAGINAFGEVQPQRSAATLVLTEGLVYLNDRPVEASSTESVLPDAAVLRTAEGRAAVALKRGGWLLLDAGASVNILANGAYNFNRIEVLTGSAIVVSTTGSPLVQCENEMRLSDDGMFRFDMGRVDAAGERYCRFRVFEGAAAVPLVTVTSALRAGQSMMCNRRCGDMLAPRTFSREELDDFDQWARLTLDRLRK